MKRYQTIILICLVGIFLVTGIVILSIKCSEAFGISHQNKKVSEEKTNENSSSNGLPTGSSCTDNNQCSDKICKNNKCHPRFKVGEYCDYKYPETSRSHGGGGCIDFPEGYVPLTCLPPGVPQPKAGKYYDSGLYCGQKRTWGSESQYKCCPCGSNLKGDLCINLGNGEECSGNEQCVSGHCVAYQGWKCSDSDKTYAYYDCEDKSCSQEKIPYVKYLSGKDNCGIDKYPNLSAEEKCCVQGCAGSCELIQTDDQGLYGICLTGRDSFKPCKSSYECASNTCAWVNDRGDNPTMQCCPTKNYAEDMHGWDKNYCIDMPLGSSCVVSDQCDNAICSKNFDPKGKCTTGPSCAEIWNEKLKSDKSLEPCCISAAKTAANTLVCSKWGDGTTGDKPWTDSVFSTNCNGAISDSTCVVSKPYSKAEVPPWYTCSTDDKHYAKYNDSSDPYNSCNLSCGGNCAQSESCAALWNKYTTTGETCLQATKQSVCNINCNKGKEKGGEIVDCKEDSAPFCKDWLDCGKFNQPCISVG